MKTCGESWQDGTCHLQSVNILFPKTGSHLTQRWRWQTFTCFNSQKDFVGLINIKCWSISRSYHGDEKKSAAPITSFPPFIAASWCQQLSWDKKKKRRFLPGAGGIITCDRHHSTLSQGGGPEERKVLENKRRGVKGGRRPKEGGVQIGGIKGGSLVHAFHVWNITSVLDFLNVLWRRNLG